MRLYRFMFGVGIFNCCLGTAVLATSNPFGLLVVGVGALQIALALRR